MQWNDQIKLNNALKAMHPDWGDTEGKSILDDEQIATTQSGLKVTVLPAKYVCRQDCNKDKRDQYYIWHKGGKKVSSGKKANLNSKKVRLWFLREDWEDRENSSSTGEDWLREITEVR